MPPWTRDEVVLALDLYLANSGLTPPTTDDRVLRLSKVLRAMPGNQAAALEPRFRNPNGVSLKLRNLHAVATGGGMPNGSQVDLQVWKELGSDPAAARREAQRILEGIPGTVENREQLRIAGYTEGGQVLEAHYRRERSPELRSQFLAARRKAGRLSCEICAIAASEQHAALSEGRFEVHHIVPLGSGEGRETTLADLALLCANCHRLIHTAMSLEQRWIGINDARSYLRQRGLA